ERKREISQKVVDHSDADCVTLSSSARSLTPFGMTRPLFGRCFERRISIEFEDDSSRCASRFALRSFHHDVDLRIDVRANKSTKRSLARTESGNQSHAAAGDRLRHSLGREDSVAGQGGIERDALFAKNARRLGA